MNKILYVNACAREGSRTNELALKLLTCLEGEVYEINLYNENIKPLDADMIELRDTLVKSGNMSHEYLKYAKEFAAADIIVVGAPYWDLLFPAVLRTYLEAVSVCGVTFRYSEKGIPVGLCKAKKLYYIATAGGFFGDNNFGFSYVKALAQNLYGISDVHSFTAEGLDIIGNNVTAIMQEAKNKIVEECK